VAYLAASAARGGSVRNFLDHEAALGASAATEVDRGARLALWYFLNLQGVVLTQVIWPRRDWNLHDTGGTVVSWRLHPDASVGWHYRAVG